MQTHWQCSHNNNATCLTVNIHLNMNALSFCHEQQGFCYDAYCVLVCQKLFTLRCFLANFRQAFIFLPREQWFLSWCPAMNLIFLVSFWWWTHERWPMPRTKEACRPLDVEMGFFLTSCVISILCSWRDFGRMMSSWKIHSCPRVSLLLQYALGWVSLESWRLRNDFGRVSRLTGVNIIPLEMLKYCVWSWHDAVLKPVCWWLLAW